MLDVFGMIEASSTDPDGLALVVAGMDAAERGEVIAQLLGLVTAILEAPDRRPVETLALFLAAARNGGQE